MNIIVCKNYEEMSERAASFICDVVRSNKNATLGLATGSTPIGMYRHLRALCAKGELDLSGITTFNLDEYYPMKKDNRQSYDYFMRENLFDGLGIDPARIHIPSGEAEDADAECKAYEQMIDDNGGIDIQVLGIGVNGHIGFNEPADTLFEHTHKTALTESTMQANARFFTKDEIMPDSALTMGIASIFKARKIILLASGASKREIVSRLLDGGISTQVPASLLKLHPDVTIICDEEAYCGR